MTQRTKISVAVADAYAERNGLPKGHMITFNDGLPTVDDGIASVSYTHLTLPTIYSV